MTCNAPEPMFPNGRMVCCALLWVDGGHREVWHDAAGNSFVPEGPLQRNLLRYELENQRKQVSEQVLDACGKDAAHYHKLRQKPCAWEHWIDVHHPGIIPDGLFQ